MAPPNATPPSAPEWYAAVPSGTAAAAAAAAAARAARRSSASLTRLPPRFLRAESPWPDVGHTSDKPFPPPPATSSVPSVSPSDGARSADPRSSASSPPHPFHPPSVGFGSFVVRASSRVAFSETDDRSTSADAPPSTFKPLVAAHSAGPGSAREPPTPAAPAPPGPAPPWRSSLRRSSLSASCSAATLSSSAWNASREDVTSAAARSFSETRGGWGGEPGGLTPPGRPRPWGPPTSPGGEYGPRGVAPDDAPSAAESIIDLGGGRWMSRSSSSRSSSRLSRLYRRLSSDPCDERRSRRSKSRKSPPLRKPLRSSPYPRGGPFTCPPRSFMCPPRSFMCPPRSFTCPPRSSLYPSTPPPPPPPPPPLGGGGG